MPQMTQTPDSVNLYLCELVDNTISVLHVKRTKAPCPCAVLYCL